MPEKYSCECANIGVELASEALRAKQKLESGDTRGNDFSMIQEDMPVHIERYLGCFGTPEKANWEIDWWKESGRDNKIYTLTKIKERLEVGEDLTPDKTKAILECVLFDSACKSESDY